MIITFKSCAVTSCRTQGAQGPKGDKGDTGAAGQDGKDGKDGKDGVDGKDGEPGKDGKDGVSYYTVVIVEADVEGGKVTTNTVTGKEGDEFVLTFTPKTEGNIVVNLRINYEDVELTDEILNGSYTGKFSGNVVVSATFGDVDEYGKSLVQSYYNEKASNDSQMPWMNSASTYVTRNTTGESYVKNWVKGSYYKYGEEVAKVAVEYNTTKVAAVKNSFKKDVTTKEKITAYKELAEKAKKDIDAKYTEQFGKAKEDAAAAITKLYKGVNEDYMSASDISAMSAAATSELSSVTTLAGLSEVIDGNNAAIEDKVSSYVKVGKYDEIERLRNTAFESLEDKIESIYKKDAALDGDSDDEDIQEAHKTLVAELKQFGLSEDDLPGKVFEDKIKEVSAAKEFSYATNKDGTVNYAASTLEESSVKAVQDCYDNIGSTVRTSVLNSYYKEIDASEYLTTEQAKVACKGAVETAISEWYLAHGKSKNATITNFVSSQSLDGVTSSEEVDKLGGVGYIEYVLDENYKAFQSERLENKKEVIAEELQASAKELIDSDTLYKTIISAKIGDDGDYEDEKDLNDSEKLGLKNAKATIDGLRVVGSTTRNLIDDSTDVSKFMIAVTVNTSGYDVSATGENDGGYLTAAVKEMTKVTELLKYQSGVLEAMETVYANALKSFIKTEGGVIESSSDVHEKYGQLLLDADKLSTLATNLTKDAKSVTELQGILKNVDPDKWVSLIDILGASYVNYFEAYKALGYTVDATITSGKNATYYDINKQAVGLIDKIVDGTLKTAADVQKAMGRLSMSTTISNYAEAAKKALEDVRANLVNEEMGSAGSVTKIEAINKAYANWIDVAGEGVFSFGYLTDVDNWLKCATVDLNNVDASKNTDYAHDIQEAYDEAYTVINNFFTKEKCYGTTDFKTFEGGRKLTDKELVTSSISGLMIALEEAVDAAVTSVVDGSTEYSEITELVGSIQNIARQDQDGKYVFNDTYINNSSSKTIKDYVKAEDYKKDALDALDTVYDYYEGKLDVDEDNTNEDEKAYKLYLLNKAYATQVININAYTVLTDANAKALAEERTTSNTPIMNIGEKYYYGTSITALKSAYEAAYNTTVQETNYSSYLGTLAKQKWFSAVCDNLDMNAALFDAKYTLSGEGTKANPYKFTVSDSGHKLTELNNFIKGSNYTELYNSYKAYIGALENLVE